MVIFICVQSYATLVAKITMLYTGTKTLHVLAHYRGFTALDAPVTVWFLRRHFN
jgi:hypothetical protein